ncbi:MAG TPA: hypothetical protein VF235_01985, partial [Actinomycetota bacterium]
MRLATRSFVVVLMAVLVAGTSAVSGSVPPPDRWRACGEWTAVAMPLVGYTTVMEDVAVVSPDDAWAVGFAERGDRRVPVTLHWDGWRWNVADTPTIRGWGGFSGVAATGPEDVWAVGT